MTQLATEVAGRPEILRVERPPALRARNRSQLRTAVALTGLALVPMLVLALRLLVFERGIAPYSDVAVTEMSVRDIGHHPVLTGAYGRFGWHHLGPAFFYLLAVPYKVFGTSAAMYAGAAVFNAAIVVLIVAIAYRRGRMRLAVWTVAVMSLYLAAVSPGVVSSPWNPLLALFPFIAFVLAMWCVSVGDLAWLPVAAGLGTYCVQTHSGYVGPVAIAVVVGVVGARTRKLPARRWLAPIVVAAVVAGVLWLPPLIDQVRPGGGNMGDVAAWTLHSKGDHSISGESAPTVVRELGALPARATNAAGTFNADAQHGAADAPWAFGLLTLVGTVASAFIAWRRRDRDTLWLFGLSGVLIVAAVGLLARYEGPLFGWLTIWTSAVGVVCWIAIGNVVMPKRASTPRARIAYGVVLALVAVMALGNTVAALTTNDLTLEGDDIVTFTDAVMPHVPSIPGTQVYGVAGSTRTWTVLMGVMNQLEKRGVRVKAKDYEWIVGTRRSASTQPPGSAEIVFSDATRAVELRRDPTYKPLFDNGYTYMFLATDGERP